MNYYIHIPFCKSKCKYCHFASFPGINDIQKNIYIEFLKKEIKDFINNGCHSGNLKDCPESPLYSKSSENNNTIIGRFLPTQEGQIDNSIYFGGGTPSILSIPEIKGILDIFQSPLIPPCKGGEIEVILDKRRETEITLEANPEFVTREYIEGLMELGINRISLGIQTLNDKSLEEIGRCNVEKIYKALDILQELDFPNVGVDFIIGLSFVNKGDTQKDIEKLLAKYNIIKHISVYMLEQGKYPDSWKANSLEDEELGTEYEGVAEYLELKGFTRYELSNFALPGYECRHNSGYWNHTEYVGFGLSAASFVDNRRFANSSDFGSYYASKLEYEEDLSEKDLNLEKMMFDFRTVGVRSDLVKNQNKLEEFKNDSLVLGIGNILKPTNKGVAIVDYIFREVFL